MLFGLIPETGIAAKGFELIDPIGKRVRVNFKAVFFLEQTPGIGLVVTQAIETDGVKDYLQRILLAFENPGGEGLPAGLAEIELDCFVFGLAPAALDHFPTLTVGAMVGCSVWGLTGILPEQIKMPTGFYFFGF